MNDTKPSSDDKLLAMIRKKDKQRQFQNREQIPIKDEEGAVAVKPTRRKLFKVNVFYIWKIFNACLLLMTLVLAGRLSYLVLNTDSIEAIGPLPQIPTFTNVDENVDIEENFAAPAYETFVSVINEKDIFISPWENNVIQPQINTDTSVTLLESKIRILGVVLGKNSSVIIEKIPTQETVFLAPGDSIDGAEVVEIKDGLVQFSYQGSLQELTF